MNYRITAAVLIGLFLFLVSHILAMALLEITPDETPAVAVLATYLSVEAIFAFTISILTTKILTNSASQALLILVILIGVITAPSIMQNGSKWALSATYFCVMPIIYFGRFVLKIHNKEIDKIHPFTPNEQKKKLR